MDFLIFLIAAIIFFSFFGGKKKKKTKRQPRPQPQRQPRPVLSPRGVNQPVQWGSQSQPRIQKNYETVEQGAQNDSDANALYKLSKERLDRAQKLARKAAAAKLSHKGLPTTGDDLQSFETTAKNTQMGSGHVAIQPPLVRDMNVSRKLFLSGGRGNTLGERQKKTFGLKAIFSVVGLGLTAFYLIGVLGA